MARIDDDEDSYRDADLSDLLDEDHIVDLAAAIRRGDRGEAEVLLDRIASDDFRVEEWVQKGRFSNKAKQPEAMRKAA